MRGVGAASLLGDLAGPLVVLFAVLTQLGDVWLLVTLVALAYWLDAHAPLVGPGLDRERTALLVALLFGALALTTGLKSLFALPRPAGAEVAAGADLLPAAARDGYASIATASGYGFPSGHAVGASIVWGGLAWATRVGRARTRAALAGAVVAVVALSRLVLGVHFLVDVGVGVGVGLAYLLAVLRWCERPIRGFLAALAVAAAGAVLAASGIAAGPLATDHAAVLGLALGATAAWAALGGRLSSSPSRSGALATATLGVVVAGPVLLVAVVGDSLAVAGVAAAAGGALLVAMPLAGERVAAAVGE